MKKLILALTVFWLVAPTAYAGILNGQEDNVFPTVKQFVDNAMSTDNYTAGAFHNLKDKQTLQNFAVKVYDFTGTEEVLQPEGENLKHYFDYASLLVGYADNETVNAAAVVNVLPTIKGALIKTPYANKVVTLLPNWLDIYFGPTLGYDFGDNEVAYGVTTNAAIDWQF